MNLSLELLEKAARNERLAHLLLFHGGGTAERRSSGIHLAQLLNCSSPKEVVPCNECSSCRKISTGSHPDVEVLTPQKSSFGIEQVLSLKERVYRKHFEGKYKVFILEQADLLTIPAANALLKMIEEPPERTLIILSAQNAETLLPTIRSRAQGVYFPTTAESQWLSSLEESNSQEDAKEAFTLSGQNPDLAEEILQVGNYKIKEWIQIFNQAVRDRDFLILFNIFPIEKSEALVFLQCLAQESFKKTVINPKEMLSINKSLEQMRVQANPRLVIEVLALDLFQ